MKVDRGRTYLTLMWVVAFAVAFLGFLYLRFHVEIGPESAAKLFESILTIYSPLIGAVLGFHFAKHFKHREPISIPVVALVAAVTMSMLWNLFAAGLIIRACLDPDKTPDAIAGLSTYVPKLSWIVSPVLGFFFGKSSEAGG